jgi:hypothetical protein
MGKVKEQVDQETGEIMPPQSNLPANVLPAPKRNMTAEAMRDAPPPPAMPITGFAKLADAIAAVTKEIAEDPIEKKGKNAFHNYSYARMQDILGGLTPLMAKHGVVVMQTEVERGFMDNGNAIFATYDFTIMHKSGEVWPFPQRQTGVSNTRTSKGTFDDKGLNKCSTAARKYFLLALFQIPTTDEDDADKHGDYVPPKQAPKHEAPKQEPVQKAIPHEIPRPKGIKAVDWGRMLVEQIKLCNDIEGIDSWMKANDSGLKDLEKMAPQIYDRVCDVEKTRREELGQVAQ